MPRRKKKRAHVQSPCFRIRRGDIYLADLGTKADVIGSEQFGVRPVLITQCNRQNDRSTTYNTSDGEGLVQAVNGVLRATVHYRPSETPGIQGTPGQ